jgi:hypothetical protein
MTMGMNRDVIREKGFSSMSRAASSYRSSGKVDDDWRSK